MVDEHRILIDIEGKQIERIEYGGQPVLTFRMIDELHERPEGTARKTFNRHKDRFSENEDFFDVPYEEWSRILCVRYTDAQANRRDFMRFITESGYLMIVKPFGDDVSWRIQRALVRNYFVTRELLCAASREGDALLGQTARILGSVHEELAYMRQEREFLKEEMTHLLSAVREELAYSRQEKDFFRDRFFMLQDQMNSEGSVRKTPVRKSRSVPSPGSGPDDVLITFASVWWNEHGDDNVGVSHLYPLLERHDISLGLGKGSERSRRIRMGRKLTDMLGRQFGDYVVTPGKPFRNIKRYGLRPVPPRFTSGI